MTRAWCLPTWKGGGTVGVTFVMDNNASIFPEAADIERVADYIYSHKDPTTGLIVGAPDGIIVTVFATTPRPVNMEILISPNTEILQDAVESALVSMFYNESTPGGSLALSHIVRAIAGVSGLNDFKLRAPTEDVIYSGSTELLVLGEIKWL